MKNEDLNVEHTFTVQSNHRTEEKIRQRPLPGKQGGDHNAQRYRAAVRTGTVNVVVRKLEGTSVDRKSSQRQQGKSRFLGPTSNTSLVYGMKEQSTGGDRAMCLWLESSVEPPVDGAALKEGHGYENREYRTDCICCGVQST